MYKILKKKILATGLVLFDIEAKRISKACKPGQFLIVRLDECAERIPLTICDSDSEKGTITIVVQIVGVSTKKISELETNDYFEDVVGPLGNPSDLVGLNKNDLNEKHILFIAGGLGAAPVYPQAKYLSSEGVDFEVIIGAKNKNLLILEDEYKKLNRNIYICTDDFSYGFKGPVTNVLKKLCDGTIRDEEYKCGDGNIVKGKDIYKDIDKKEFKHIVAIGSAVMMKYTCMLTRELNIKTIVSMNTLMVDGTGMCGACRLMVGDKLKFCCIDGPEFDGHMIDFDSVITRLSQYKDEESRVLLKYNEGSTHKGNCY